MPKKNKSLTGYWNEKLKRMGLSMEAGRSRRLVYVGGNIALQTASEIAGTELGVQVVPLDKRRKKR